jgi:serine/threonine protein kinase
VCEISQHRERVILGSVRRTVIPEFLRMAFLRALVLPLVSAQSGCSPPEDCAGLRSESADLAPSSAKERLNEMLRELHRSVSISEVLIAVGAIAIAFAAFRRPPSTPPRSCASGRGRPRHHHQQEDDEEDEADSNNDQSDNDDEDGSGDGAWIHVRGRKWEGAFKFRERDRINSEGSARVYRGRDEKSGQPVCIKVAAKGGQLYNDRVIWDHLLSTGGWSGLPRLHARINNFGEDDGEEVLVSELCGPSLSSYLKRRSDNRLETTEACAVCLEILRHLRLMHGAGFAHRDVTPANFLFSRRVGGHPAPLLNMIDFGVSQRFPTRGKAKQDPSGTLRFATPYLGTAPLAPRDDLFSLGYVLIATIAGSLPWDEQACRSCAAGTQARRQRSEVAELKLELLREGVASSSFPALASLSSEQAKLLEAFFDLIGALGADEPAPYDQLQQLLSASGEAAAQGAQWMGSFPPASLEEMRSHTSTSSSRRAVKSRSPRHRASRQ